MGYGDGNVVGFRVGFSDGFSVGSVVGLRVVIGVHDLEC